MTKLSLPLSGLAAICGWAGAIPVTPPWVAEPPWFTESAAEGRAETGRIPGATGAETGDRDEEAPNSQEPAPVPPLTAGRPPLVPEPGLLRVGSAVELEDELSAGSVSKK